MQLLRAADAPDFATNGSSIPFARGDDQKTTIKNRRRVIFMFGAAGNQAEIRLTAAAARQHR
jgi:hypothetical protein